LARLWRGLKVGNALWACGFGPSRWGRWGCRRLAVYAVGYCSITSPRITSQVHLVSCLQVDVTPIDTDTFSLFYLLSRLNSNPPRSSILHRNSPTLALEPRIRATREELISYEAACSLWSRRYKWLATPVARLVLHHQTLHSERLVPIHICP
jgi:hypothetical protein